MNMREKIKKNHVYRMADDPIRRWLSTLQPLLERKDLECPEQSAVPS